MKKMFLFSLLLLISSIITIPISLVFDSELLLVIGILLPIIIGTFSMILFWKYTMQYPKNEVEEFKNISLPKNIETNIVLTFVNQNGVWTYRHDNQEIKINLKGYLFPTSFIKSYVIRQLRYHLVNKKLPITDLFRRKFLIKKYVANNIYLETINNKRTSRTVVVRQGVSLHTLLSQLISQSSYYRDLLFMRSLVSLKRNKSFIDEVIYNNRRRTTKSK
ncbi:MAG: hypothetical protein KKH01_09800 [Firmicutes bacterium]|nr:hypothetical protein [Bacillota bacterium]